MIPNMIDIGSPWRVLPAGVHDATLEEIEKRFAFNEHRKRLFEGLRRAAQTLKKAGCLALYVDGSFVTEKPFPGDYDACWDSSGVNAQNLDAVLLDFRDKRRAQKSKFLGELFPAAGIAAPGWVFIDFFQRDRHTGKKKGIVRIQL